MRNLIVLALLAFSACGGDSTTLVNNGEADLGMDERSNNGGQTNNIVFPKEDMGSPDVGTCTEGAEDRPDDQFFDANCDGIDGDIEDSIFVATYGDDANPGTQALPIKTIQAGIDAAKTGTKSWVLISDGQHDGGFKLEDGISIAGGFGFGWKRSRGARTSVRGGSPVILAADITLPTSVISLDIQSGMPEPGQAALTIAVQNSSGLSLENLTLQGGTGGDGTDGMKGTVGTDGAIGANGGNAPKDSNSIGICKNQDNPPGVGAGAPATCVDNAGGTGGEAGFKKNSGKKGGNSASGGGVGGGGGPGFGPGVIGGFGNSGTLGNPGIGAQPGGSFNVFVWEGISGSVGEAGNPGAGGGGGGGGGGGYESLGCDSWGGAGGGGGSGGCGGTGGQGGGPGGASVVLFLINSPETKLINCRLLGGQGGRGGSGGAGGAGGAGGGGGTGGNNEENSGDGAKGGIGGAGGIGGTGGAGSGGPSFGIYSDLELTITPVGTDIMEGFGGEGGSSPSVEGRGEKGIAEAIHIGAL